VTMALRLAGWLLGEEVSWISPHRPVEGMATYTVLRSSKQRYRRSRLSAVARRPSPVARRSGKNRDLTVRRLQTECGMKRHRERRCNDTDRDVRHMHEVCVLTPTVVNSCNHQCPQPPPFGQPTP